MNHDRVLLLMLIRWDVVMRIIWFKQLKQNGCCGDDDEDDDESVMNEHQEGSESKEKKDYCGSLQDQMFMSDVV